MLTRSRSVWAIVAVAFAAVLILSAPLSAQAGSRKVVGDWVTLRGTINVPLWIPSLPTAVNTGLLGLSRPEIPGSGSVNTTGVPPQTISLPQGFFIDQRNQIAGFRKAFGAGSLVQFETSFNFSAPVAAAVLRKGPKASRPVDFAFCPGAAANPGCTTPITGGAQGTKLGIVTYTHGASQFGGTMQILLGGNSTVSLTIGGSPIRISHRPVAVVGTQHGGGAYSVMASDTLLGGKVTNAVQTTSTKGLITAIGPILSTGGTSMLTNTGFPFTTGMITIKLPAQGTGSPFTVIVTGSDKRTPKGAGNITLVAGGLSHRSNGPAFATIDTATMQVVGGTPALSPIGLSAMAVLLMAGGGYVLRRRFV